MANSQTTAWGVTCSARADSALCQRAIAIAQELGCTYWDRPEVRLSHFIHVRGLSALVVVGQRDIVVHTPHARLRHHPNAAVLRVVNMLRDRRDTFVELAQLAPGDHLLDCTCGVGADAIAAAHAVGTDGSVHALEASPLLALLTRCGMQRYQHPNHGAVTAAMRRVRVSNARYQDMLPTYPDNCVDVVYFDPMFSQTFTDSNGLELVRAFAQTGLPQQNDIAEAKRVARRCVLMKDQIPGRTLQALGFSVIKKARRFCYGRI
tara:strand:+ start:135 stop:923 length:789 start_codon:yes stop_codon:yes gene_type:complete